MNVSLDVLTHLGLYLSGKLSLQSLREWEVGLFVRRRELDANDQKFLLAFERHFAELSVGLPENEFKRMLRSLAQPPMIEVQVSPPQPSLLLSTSGTSYYPPTSPGLYLRNVPELSPA